VSAIFQVDEHDLPWMVYERAPEVRVKPLTRHNPEVPPAQYVEYAPGHTDPLHSHSTDEWFIVTDGQLWLDESCNGPGSAVFIPRGTEYAVRAGSEGVRYFRVVLP
jgi:quercetin dioxygenase-like cupin family protein